MRTWRLIRCVGVILTLEVVLGGGVRFSLAQQVTVASPFHTARDSFYESNTIGWSGNYKGFNFSFGGAAQSHPAFGGFDPSAGLSANFGISGKDGQINFATNFNQGYRQSLVSQTPSVTLMNGQTGFISDTSQTPFVISVIPVVGAQPIVAPPMPFISNAAPGAVNPRLQAFAQAHADAQAAAANKAQNQAPNQVQGGAVPPPPPQPGQPNNPAAPKTKLMNVAEPVVADPGQALADRLDGAQQSTAGRPALSVAEARQLHRQEQGGKDNEMAALMERARALEEDGKPNVAKIYYQRVAKHGTGEMQQQAQTKLYEIQGTVKP